MAKIRIVGSEEPVDVEPGMTLLSALQRGGIPISGSCGGQATCGFCRLSVVDGKALLSPVSSKEIVHLGNVAKVVDLRLSCQATVESEGEIEVVIPPVVDVAARKREQSRRGMVERSGRRRSVPGALQESQNQGDKRDSRPQSERIEWRPSRLSQPSDEVVEEQYVRK